MIVFACPGCQQRLQVGDEGAGKKVKCPRCTRVVAVPTIRAGYRERVANRAARIAPSVQPTTESLLGPDTIGGGVGAAPDATEAGQVGPLDVGAAVPPDLAGNPRYRVLALLGQGGMGAVYKAEHKRMERTVALKVINPALVESTAAVRRFHQEVKAAARLHHPHIVTAFDADQAGSLHFLVMEYVEGQSLVDYLRQRGPLPASEACEYVRQAALALQHAHEQGMIHRDIKPHNMMRTAQGQIKILDFGLARFATTGEPPGQSQLTGAGVLMGTPDYIAPEQASDAHKADIRDIYSLGCTLYQLLTGRVPYPGGSSMDKIIQHSVGQPAPLASVRPDLPQGLPAVLAKMMAKNPAKRYQVPAAVAAALTPFAAPAAATVTYPPLATPVGNRADVASRRPQRRGLWKWIVAAAAALALLAAAVAAVAVYRISTDAGELVITPESPDVDVVVSQNGKQVEIVDTKTMKRVKLPSGVYDLSLQGAADGLELTTDRITVRRGDTVLATVQFLPKADPKVLVVAADGSGQYRSVRAALLEAKDGMSVRVKPGTYKEEPLVVHSDVAVEGDGPVGGVVIETTSDDEPCIQSLAAHAVFRNLTIRAHANNAMLIAGGGAVVEDCTFTILKSSEQSPAVVWVDADAKARFLRTKVKGDPMGVGFKITGKSEASLEDCEVFDNAYQNVWVGEQARATLSKCRIHDGKLNGVFLDGKGRVTIDDCEIAGNGENGVACYEDGSAVLHQCKVIRNLMAGLAAYDRGAITDVGCELTGNVEGPTYTEANGKIDKTPPAKSK